MRYEELITELCEVIKRQKKDAEGILIILMKFLKL